jgi:hypothetical protein
VVEKEKDGTLSLVNALKANIDNVWLADVEGKIYTAAAMAADGKTVLTPTGKRAAAQGARLRQAFAGDWLALVDMLSAHPEEYLRPGCYIAVLPEAPFIPVGLDSATPGQSRSVVLGIMKTP